MYLYRTMISIKAGLELLLLSFISFIFILLLLFLLSLLLLVVVVVVVVVDRFRPKFEVAAGIEFGRLGLRRMNTLSPHQTKTNCLLISRTCFLIMSHFMPVDLLDK